MKLPGGGPITPHVGVIGAGWAGLAAAVECASQGARVTVFEMAPQAGGRARGIGAAGDGLDNGQHIAIGAYRATLDLLARIGVAEHDVFWRRPLALVGPGGDGLRLTSGDPTVGFVRGVLARGGWSWRDRLALLVTAARWRRSGFVCAPTATVADLARALPACVRSGLIEPLCIAALNTPSAEASGTVFLRILRDALAGGNGASDLLLPKVGLSAVLPEPALAWLVAGGGEIRLATRVAELRRDGRGWQLDSERFDRVVIAASTAESARLVGPHDAAWAGRARALAYEPIVTVYATSPGVRLPEPMLMLEADADAGVDAGADADADADADAHFGKPRPAQFVFDRGALGGPPGLLAFVVSGAAAWVARGLDATEAAVLAQADDALAPWLGAPLEPVRTVVEKRATFRCTPQLDRPPMHVAPGLAVAGDYVAGPYPATLEGAIRSGVAAANAVLAADGFATIS